MAIAAAAAMRMPALAPWFVSARSVLSFSSFCDTSSCKKIISILIMYLQLTFCCWGEITVKEKKSKTYNLL
jgi:hypothetical protein